MVEKLLNMAKFKKGDRVRNLEATHYVPNGATGTVESDDSRQPWVIWDEVTERAKMSYTPTIWSQHEHYLELIETDKEQPKELTLLEKFEQGWEIRSSSGHKVVALYPSKNGERLIVEWSDGDVWSAPITVDGGGWILTPPKERKTLYVYMHSNGTHHTSEQENVLNGFKLISTIHTEKNGDEWEVVK